MSMMTFLNIKHLIRTKRLNNCFGHTRRPKVGKFMRKPVRRVRRFLKRKGKGKGKNPGYYLSTLSEGDLEQLFFAKGRPGKGKGKGIRSSGKGKGRRMNPKGADGKIMKCRKCGSIEHFQKDCPKNQGGGPPAGIPGKPAYFMEIEQDRPQPAPLSLPTSSSSSSRIAEIIGTQEHPLPTAPKKHVHFTFFNDYRHGLSTWTR